MKNTSILYLSLVGWLLTSCNAIYGIFKTGVGFGVIATLAIIIGIIVLVNRMGRGKKE